jgi:hypothetical protein
MSHGRRTNPYFLSDGEAECERRLTEGMVRGMAANRQQQQEIGLMTEKVQVSLRKFWAKDIALIQVNANERSISHKLAQYLEEQFKGWDVDCEYNRYGDDEKKVLNEELFGHWKSFPVRVNDEDAKSIFPDIIVHHRRTSDNLLVVEVKKSTTDWNSELDVQKLMALTRQKYKYGYKFGLRLVISMNGDATANNLEWYTDGQQIT